MRAVAGSGLVLAGLFLAFAAVAATPPGAAVAAAPGAITARAMSASAERGALLFRTKGCVACHGKSDDGIVGLTTAGPDLGGLRDDPFGWRPEMPLADYVRASLKDPAAFRLPGYAQEEMPDLGLADDEIDALVAFLVR